MKNAISLTGHLRFQRNIMRIPGLTEIMLELGTSKDKSFYSFSRLKTDRAESVTFFMQLSNCF